jgi:hypothetical protein
MKRVAFACAALIAAPLPAFAWGAQGHRIVNGAAIRALPPSLPAFVRSAGAHDEIALLGPEADRLKGAGKPLDADADPAHYVDALDDGTIDGVVAMRDLPADERAYDRALHRAEPESDAWSQGYLPYAIADGWKRLVRDFAYWRVDAAGERLAQSAEDRRLFAFDRGVREAVTLRDIGYWGHFVGDGSQPLHVSVHFNGWNGKRYGNPNGFSESKTIHSRFETALVRAVADEDRVVARVGAPRALATPILAEVGTYLATTESFVPAVYRLEAAGGIDGRSAAATALVLDRLAAGAAELRDLIVAAWVASEDAKIGHPGIAVRMVESGGIAPTAASIGLSD